MSEISYAAVLTNGQARPLKSYAELPEAEQSDFDYLDVADQHTTRFVAYRGSWYDVHDAQLICTPDQYAAFGFNVSETHPLAAWDGINTDSHWTGVVFRYLTESEALMRGLDRDEYIIVGRYIA